MTPRRISAPSGYSVAFFHTRPSCIYSAVFTCRPISASASFARTSRIPAGHHEGFMEAFANIYDEFCAAVKTREPRDFPGAHEGVRTMRFVEAVLASHKAGGAWTKV